LECTYGYEETGERGQSINANVVNIGVYWYLPGEERGHMAPRFCARGDDAEFGRDSNPRVIYPLVGERYIQGYYRSLREGSVVEQARALTVELVQAMGEFAAVCPGVSLPTASMDCIDPLLISDDLEELDDADELADEVERELADVDEDLDIEEPDLEGLADELDALELDEGLNLELDVCPGA
jgi:hypothetical protein